MLQLYMDLASSRLACRDIQRIQPIQPIQLYSYTQNTAYSTIQPPSAASSAAAAAETTEESIETERVEAWFETERDRVDAETAQIVAESALADLRV